MCAGGRDRMRQARGFHCVRPTVARAKTRLTQVTSKFSRNGSLDQTTFGGGGEGHLHRDATHCGYPQIESWLQLVALRGFDSLLLRMITVSV